MPTDYTGIPSLTERLRAADYVVTGAFGSLLEERAVTWAAPERIAGIFELRVEDVLLGSTPKQSPRIRVLGDRRREHSRWPVPVDSDLRQVFLLVHDIEPEMPEALYAPCWSGVYPIDAQSRLMIPLDQIDDVLRSEVDADGRLSLEVLRRLINALQEERAAQAREAEELLRFAGLQEGLSGAPTEMPQRADDAGRPGQMGGKSG